MGMLTFALKFNKLSNKSVTEESVDTEGVKRETEQEIKESFQQNKAWVNKGFSYPL